MSSACIKHTRTCHIWVWLLRTLEVKYPIKISHWFANASHSQDILFTWMLCGNARARYVCVAVHVSAPPLRAPVRGILRNRGGRASQVHLRLALPQHSLGSPSPVSIMTITNAHITCNVCMNFRYENKNTKIRMLLYTPESTCVKLIVHDQSGIISICGSTHSGNGGGWWRWWGN